MLQHVVSMASFTGILNDAHFYAESIGEGPTLQLNDMLEKFTKNCVRRTLRQNALVSLTYAGYTASSFW